MEIVHHTTEFEDLKWQIQISSAQYLELDWLIAHYENPPEFNPYILSHLTQWIARHNESCNDIYSLDLKYSIHLVEREGMLLGPSPIDTHKFAACIGNEWQTGRYIAYGPTYALAAMRCFAISKFGIFAEFPRSLITAHRDSKALKRLLRMTNSPEFRQIF